MSELEQPPSGSPPDAVVSPAPESKAKRVLLIEDEAQARLLFLQKLREAGFEVEVAPNGRVALQKLRSHCPDAIFMDLLLPSVKGVDVIKEARQNPKFADRPIYACTSAVNMRAWTRRGTKAGATKVFDRARTPIDQIVAEVAADLIKPSASAAASGALPGAKVEFPTLPHPPRQTKANTAPAGRLLQTRVRPEEGSAAKSSDARITFVQRLLKSFRRTETAVAASESVLSPAPVRVAKAPEPIASQPCSNVARSGGAPSVVAPTLTREIQFHEAPTGPLDGVNDPSADSGAAVFTLAEAGKIVSEMSHVPDGPSSEEMSRLQASLAATRRANEELGKQCEAISAEAMKQGQALAESEQERAELQQRMAANQHELQRAQTTLEQERTELQQLEQKLRGFATAKAGLEMQLAEQSQSREDLLKSSAQALALLDEAQAGAARAEEGLKEKSAQCSQVEEELAKLRNERDELSRMLAAEQQAAAESKRRTEESEKGLREAASNLEGLKADADTHSEQRESLELALGKQLESAKAAAEQADAAFNEQVLRNKDFEKRLQTLSNNLRQEQAERSERFAAEAALHRQEADELRDKLAVEQKAAAESKQRAEELESRVLENDRESEHAKAELEKHIAEQQRLECEWHDKLNSTEGAAEKLKAACAAAEERNKRFEEELAALRELRDDLTEKLATEQAASAESRRLVEEREDCLRQNAAELERVTAELEKTKGDERFKMELAGLYQMRDLLSDKLTTEKRATAAAGQGVAQFEDRLRENAAELERLRGDQNKQAEEHAHAESKLLSQRHAARTAAEKAEAALKKKVAQCSKFETKLAALQQVRAELNSKIAAEQQASVEARQRSEELENRLRESTAELERVKADLSNQLAEQERREHELHDQLDTAKAASGRAEAVLEEERSRNRTFEERLRLLGNNLRLEEARHAKRFEDELADSRQQRDELAARLKAAEQEAAGSRRHGEEAEHRLREMAAQLGRVKLELDKQAEARRRLESELSQRLEGTKAAAQQADAAYKEESGRSSRLGQELADLQQARDELSGRLKAAEQEAAAFRRHGEEAENRLRGRAAELEQVKLELDKHAEARRRLESEVRGRLEGTKAAVQQADAAYKEESARSSRLGQELADLQQARDELSGRLRTAQDAAAASSRRVDELENHLRESAAELARSKAALENQAAEWVRQESARHKDAGTRKEAGKEPPVSREGAVAHPAEILELERRLRQSVALLARVTADLENERSERRRSEQRADALATQSQELHEQLRQHLELGSVNQTRLTALEQHLREREETMNRLSADLEKETSERQLAEEQLRASGSLSAQLQSCLSAFDQATKGFKRRQDELDLEVQGHQKALAESHSKLEKEIRERQRAEESLGALQGTHQEQSQKGAGELSKLQSELSRLQSALDVEQAERRRLEGDAIQSRYGSLDAARMGLTTVNRFRKQMREPVDHLMQSTRRLLEIGLEEQQKKLVESMLEDTLLLQTNLQESSK